MAAEQKPRIYQGGRDMIYSLALIVVAMAVAVGATGLCTYEPGTPEGGPVQEVDAVSFMGMEARAATFPVRMPENPEGWKTNSARRSMVNQEPVPVVGWVTTDRGFIQLTQTSETVDDAVRGVDSDLRELERTVTIAGEEVEIYHSEESGVRDLWVVDMGDSRLIYTGAGTDEEFHTLIEATITAEPLPSS